MNEDGNSIRCRTCPRDGDNTRRERAIHLLFLSSLLLFIFIIAFLFNFYFFSFLYYFHILFFLHLFIFIYFGKFMTIYFRLVWIQ